MKRVVSEFRQDAAGVVTYVIRVYVPIYEDRKPESEARLEEIALVKVAPPQPNPSGPQIRAAQIAALDANVRVRVQRAAEGQENE